MTNLVIGYGEIGKAVGAVIGEHDWTDRTIPPKTTYDIIHICYPCTDDQFVSSVIAYAELYHPEHIVIWATVPIGTTKQIPGAVHSPVEAQHPNLEMGIRFMERWVGYNDEAERQFFTGYFQNLGLRVKPVANSDCTEALKLLSTTEYGINIVFADYKKRIADNIGMDFELTKEWNRCYNSLYKNLGLEKRFQKFVLDPPNGKIGGHCVRENSRLLQEQYPDDWVKRIGEMG